MKKNGLFMVALLVGFAFTAEAQNLVGYRSPNPGMLNPSYEMAIEPQYDNVYLDFSDGLACVQMDRGNPTFSISREQTSLLVW